MPVSKAQMLYVYRIGDGTVVSLQFFLKTGFLDIVPLCYQPSMILVIYCDILFCYLSLTVYHFIIANLLVVMYTNSCLYLLFFCMFLCQCFCLHFPAAVVVNRDVRNRFFFYFGSVSVQFFKRTRIQFIMSSVRFKKHGLVWIL